MAEWQSIDTAPKDGSMIWAFQPNCCPGQSIMFWILGGRKGLWVYADELLSDADPAPAQPTHWMPLPEPPE